MRCVEQRNESQRLRLCRTCQTGKARAAGTPRGEQGRAVRWLMAVGWLWLVGWLVGGLVGWFVGYDLDVVRRLVGQPLGYR